MKRKRFTEEQIAFALRQVEGGVPVKEVCRKLQISEQCPIWAAMPDPSAVCGYGQAEKVSSQQEPARLAAKLEAYGLDVITIDGHDPDAISEAFDRFIKATGAGTPMAVVARTIKGCGAASLQGGGWHGKPATGEGLDQAHVELNATGVGLHRGIRITGTSAGAAPVGNRRYSPNHPWFSR